MITITLKAPSHCFQLCENYKLLTHHIRTVCINNFSISVTVNIDSQVNSLLYTYDKTLTEKHNMKYIIHDMNSTRTWHIKAQCILPPPSHQRIL